MDEALKTRTFGEKTHKWFVTVVQIRRCPAYYNARVVFLMAVITLLSTLVFLMHGSAAEQLSYISTMLLSAVAFQFVITSMLPVTSYLTLLDKYIYSSFLFLALLGVQVVLVAAITDDETGSARTSLERALFGINVGLFVGSHGLWAKVAHGRAVEECSGKMLDFRGGRASIVEEASVVEEATPTVVESVEASRVEEARSERMSVSAHSDPLVGELWSVKGTWSQLM